MRVFFIILLVFTLASPPMTNAKHLDGVVNSRKDFVFLTRFVFQPGEYGKMDYTFTYPTTECCYQMLIFNDEPNQWPYMRQHEEELNCFERKELIPSYYNGKVTLSTTQNCKIRTNNDTGEEEYFCHGKRHFDVTEERWWYIAIAHCGGDGIKNFQYNIHLINGKTAFDNEFSADERYILQTDFGFLGLYLIICGCLVNYRKLMIRRKMLNVTYRLFCYSCYLQTISLLLQTTALAKYASNGVGLENLRKLGEIISSTSILLFVLLIILIAKGYTVTRARLRPITGIKIAVFTCFFFFAYFGLYIVQQLVYDPRDVVNKYDSFAALGIVVMQFIGLAWMYYALFFTIKNHSKASFYIPFTFAFTLWFIATPATIWMSNEFIEKWKRAKIVNGLELATLFYGHVIFLLLTRPSVTNEYFPFHLTTNTVDIINTDDEEVKATEPPMFYSLFDATAAKCVVESETPETTEQTTTTEPNTAEPTTTEPTAEPTTEPTAEPTTEPTAEPTTEPTAEPTTAEPTTEPTTVEPTAEPTTVEHTAEPTTEPTTVEHTAEPTTEPTTVEHTAEPTTESTTTDPSEVVININNNNRYTSNEDISIISTPSIKLSFPADEANMLPKGRYIMVKAFVEEI